MRLRIHPPILAPIFLALISCGDPPASPSPEPNGPVISGTVFEYGPFGRRPLAGAPLDISATFVYSIPSAVTDDVGRYTSTRQSNALGSEYKVRVDAPGYYQPCYAGTVVSSQTTLDAHVVSGSILLMSGVPSSMPVTDIVVTGLVFERTAQGDRPIAGATVIGDSADPDFSSSPTPAATTRTDASGRYVLCGLKMGMQIVATAVGYRTRAGSFQAGGTLDFELRPQ
jgi:hypothetical protein